MVLSACHLSAGTLRPFLSPHMLPASCPGTTGRSLGLTALRDHSSVPWHGMRCFRGCLAAWDRFVSIASFLGTAYETWTTWSRPRPPRLPTALFLCIEDVGQTRLQRPHNACCPFAPRSRRVATLAISHPCNQDSHRCSTRQKQGHPHMWRWCRTRAWVYGLRWSWTPHRKRLGRHVCESQREASLRCDQGVSK